MALWKRPTHKGHERWWRNDWPRPTRYYPRRGRREEDLKPLFYVMFGVWITLMLMMIRDLGQR